MTHRLSPRIVASLVLLLASLTACGDDPLTIEGLAGQYVLIAAEGQALPATVQTSDTLEIEVTGGELLLLINAQYSFSVDFRLADPQNPGAATTETFIDVGPWSIVNDNLLLESTTPGRIWVGTASGSRVTLEISEPLFLEQPIVIEFRLESSG